VTASTEGSPLSGFNVRAIGPEPSGATPIEQEELDGLIPDFVAAWRAFIRSPTATVDARA
jgi:hypothetical protein